MTQQHKIKEYRHLPTIGMAKTIAVKTMLKRGKADDAMDKNADLLYDINLNGHRIWAKTYYMQDSHGVARLALITFEKSDYSEAPEITTEMVRELEKEILPPDTQALGNAELQKAISSDKQDKRPDEHARYIKSASLGRTLSESAYYHQGVHVGKCPYAEPNIIQEFRRIKNGQTVRIGFYSPYLNNCATVDG